MAPKPAFILRKGLNNSQTPDGGAIPNYCVNDGSKIDVIDVEEGLPRATLFLTPDDLEPTPQLMKELKKVEKDNTLVNIRKFQMTFGEFFAHERADLKSIVESMAGCEVSELGDVVKLFSSAKSVEHMSDHIDVTSSGELFAQLRLRTKADDQDQYLVHDDSVAVQLDSVGEQAIVPNRFSGPQVMSYDHARWGKKPDFGIWTIKNRDAGHAICLRTCPLFSTLPGEIRNEIFALALVQYEDSENAYPEDSYWYRPGFSGPRKSSSALLQTCKAAYFEGQKAFLRELEWAFWFDRGPEGRTGMNSCLSFFRKLTPQQSQDLKKVRFFMQMFRFENGTELHRLFHQPNFNPEKLTITIRYSDWWYWESDTALRMKEDWLRRFSGPAGLRELKVEYETIARKRDAMMKIVERNKKWKLSVGDSEEGGHLSAEGTKLVEWRWHGKSALGGTKWYHHGDGDTMEYVVVTDTWRYVPGLMSEEDLKKREILPPEHYPAQDSDDSDRSDEEEEDDDADYSEYEIEDEDL
ncbi:hypothetical protein K4K61_010944 [Colletotrichum sp. SAR11_59]|nr:hypothetical protein K4K61_010944 [Colletotrichum sp. SAR11_59]